MTQFLDPVLMRDFPLDAFERRQPFAFQCFEGLLSLEGFARLCADFPPLAVFERHVGLPRVNDQRPHDRYYLAYESSLYHRKDKDYALDEAGGTITHEQLAPSWQAFIDELRDPLGYGGFVARALGVSTFEMRFAWHVGTRGSEVSPHRDARDKLGTHIFYFNPRGEWLPEWGGAFLALGDKTVPRENPDFTDFAYENSIDILDNRNFLFKNTPNAWHGVRALECPVGASRRLFNVVLQTAEVPRRRGPGATLRRLFSSQKG